MAKIKKIVTSEVEGRDFSDAYDKNSLTITGEGLVVHHDGVNDGKPLIKPGIVFGANNDSGDGYGLGTIKLVPHAPDAIPLDDRYLIIDPTTPNHIHIRAGGIQDGSNAELILGGEMNNVIVNDSSRNVKVHARGTQQVMAHLNVNFESNEYLVTSDGTVAQPGWYFEINGMPYYISDVQYNTPQEGLTQFYVPGAQFAANGVYNVFSPDTSNEWTFTSDGKLYGPGPISSVKVNALQVSDDTLLYDIGQDSTVNINGLMNPGEAYLSFGNNGEVQIGNDGDNNLVLNSTFGNMNFWMDGAAYIGPSVSQNRIAQIKDIESYQNTIGQVESYSSTWSGAGLTYTGNPVIASYIKIGNLVQVQIEVNFSEVTDFGTGQYSLTLPFESAFHTDVYGGSIHNTGPTIEHYSLKGHLSQNSSNMTIWYISGSSQDQVFDFNSPINLNTTDKFHMAFSYICA